MSTSRHRLRPRSRLLLLLGDQLIRSAELAVFELVKNAYDADSETVVVSLNVDDSSGGSLRVMDEGSGMSYETVLDAWLEPGTDYRLGQRGKGYRTPKFKRVPLGEKGVGRFAVHKLGTQATLITRARREQEILVHIDWTEFENHRYLDDVPISISRREPRVFKGKKTGTLIQVTSLREKWSRGMARDLGRSINAISSPFRKKGDFRASFSVDGHRDWLQGLLTVDEVLEYSLFRARCELRGRSLTYRYDFVPLPGMDQIKPRKSVLKKPLVIQGKDGVVDLAEHGIGPVDIDLYLFDRDRDSLRFTGTARKSLTDFLNESGGIRVYRDGIRVYDYGQKGNDWLDLGGRRVNIPSQRISNNLTIGAVSLSLADSLRFVKGEPVGLVEKTNREGFVENAAFDAFRSAVSFAVTQIEAERNIDKQRLRDIYTASGRREPVLTDIGVLRDEITKRKLTDELGSYVDRIESDFVAIRDRLLVGASAGLSLSIVIHEVEKGIAELVRAVKQEKAGPRTRTLAKHLADLIEGLGGLVKGPGQKKEKLSVLIKQALFNVELRLKMHGVSVETDFADDASVKCSGRLIVSTLMNLIDNSIWWLDAKWSGEKNVKRVLIATTSDLDGGPGIVVADNGPGFIDPPEYLVQPFISRKPDGMGLGLHLAEQVMKVHGGNLLFPQARDAVAPTAFDGAVVALSFAARK